MNIRTATQGDLPAIIKLLKVSLGESLIPKSEKLWKWKHVDNPFGKSPVLVAEEDTRLIGVRAFLKWEFLDGNKTIRACRAVDTATHPDFQGKGIFNKLTLSLLDEVQKDGVELIFNTPNSKSAPGYLKMGWESWGKLPLKLNFHLLKSGMADLGNSDWSMLSGLIQKIETRDLKTAGVHTNVVNGYINWRYTNNPLYQYQFLSDGEKYLLIYRIKEGKMGREFRICDLFSYSELPKQDIKELRKSLNRRIKESGARFSSFSGLSYPNQQAIDMGILPIMKIGPLVTLRKLGKNHSPKDQLWNWSLGDLEVF